MRPHKLMGRTVQKSLVQTLRIKIRTVDIKWVLDSGIINAVGIFLFQTGADGIEILRHLQRLADGNILRRVGIDGKGQPLQRDAALRTEIGDVPLRVNAGVRAAAAGEVHRCAGDLLQRLLQRLADGDGVFLHLPAVVGRSIIHQFQCDITHIGSFNGTGRVIFPRKRARCDL